MLFCFNQKANRRLEETQQLLFFKTQFLKVFLHTPPVSQFSIVIYHSLSVDAFNIWHSEWRVKVRRRVKNAARPRFLSRQDVTDPKVCEVTLSFFLLRLVNYFFYHLRSYSQQTINKARYDAICVYECPSFNIWGLALRSKRFEASGLYSKKMLGLQATKRWGTGAPRKIF